MLLTRSRNYWLVFSASVVSNLGDGVLALLATAQRSPWLLFALPEGVWIDRADHYGLLWRTDALRALSTIADQVLLIWPLTLLAFLIGAVEGIRWGWRW